MDKSTQTPSRYPEQIIKASENLLNRIKMNKSASSQYDRSTAFAKQSTVENPDPDSQKRVTYDSSRFSKKTIPENPDDNHTQNDGSSETTEEQAGVAPEEYFWRKPDFYLGESVIHLDDKIHLKYMYDGEKDTHYVFVMKENGILQPTYLNVSMFEAREVADIIKGFLSEIGSCDPVDLIPSLKKSKHAWMTDPKNPLYWENDIVQSVSTERIKIRPSMVGGSYKIRLLMPRLGQDHATYKYRWLGKTISLSVPVAKQFVNALDDIIDRYGKRKTDDTNTDDNPTNYLPEKRTQCC